jgi:hypothetical protein
MNVLFKLLMRFKKVPQMTANVSNDVLGLTVSVHQLHTLCFVLLIKLTAFAYSSGSSLSSGKDGKRVNLDSLARSKVTLRRSLTNERNVHIG